MPQKSLPLLCLSSVIQVPLDARELPELPAQAASKRCAAKFYGCASCTTDFSSCLKCLPSTEINPTASPPVVGVPYNNNSCSARTLADARRCHTECASLLNIALHRLSFQHTHRTAKTVTRPWRLETGATGNPVVPPIYVRVGDTVKFDWAPNYVSPTEVGPRRPHNVVQLFTKDDGE
jgi:hypothetical protein